MGDTMPLYYSKNNFYKFYFHILLAIMMLLSLVAVSAQQATPSHVVMHSEPGHPAAGSTWTLTLLVAHSEPNEVDVRAPHFPDAIFLDQLLKGPRLSEETSFERWTAIEYRFTLIRPGTVSFEPFTVITPRWQESTAPFSLRVLRSPDAPETRHYQLAWEQLPPRLQTGESAIFGLRVSNWRAMAVLPDARLFMPPVPQGCILESVPVPAEERYQGVALRLRVIPLEAVPFVLDRRLIAHDGSMYEVPALRITVSTAERAAPNAPAMPAETVRAENNAAPPPFPSPGTLAAGNPRQYQRHRAQCDAIYGAAKNLWERGEFAEALAMLRQNERDHPAGGAFAAVRREAERAIGLAATNGERRRHLLSFLERQPRSAVARETAVRRVPSPSAEIVGSFGEGQPVLVPADRGSSGQGTGWLKVTANAAGGVSGWVPEERIIFF